MHQAVWSISTYFPHRLSITAYWLVWMQNMCPIRAQQRVLLLTDYRNAFYILTCHCLVYFTVLFNKNSRNLIILVLSACSLPELRPLRVSRLVGGRLTSLFLPYPSRWLAWVSSVNRNNFSGVFCVQSMLSLSKMPMKQLYLAAKWKF